MLLSKKQQRQAKVILTRIPHAETREQAEKLKKEFQSWCEKKGLEKLAGFSVTTGSGW